MEFWNYVDEGKELSSAETVSVPNSLATSRNASMNWESRDSCVLNESFGGLSFPELITKQVPVNPIGDVMCSNVSGRVSGTMIPNSSGFSGDDESSSRLSSSVVDSTSRDSSLIDLKLGRFPDHSDVHNSNFSKGTPMMSSSVSSTPTKRSRGGGESFQNAYCQVLGCGKDLSSSKDYHKRHKVCEVHSKTAKVIVNGIEQRFCQQCSRFHLLAEFDNGKRSCRKRLAGHNERRRKPQVGIHSGRAGRVLQSYSGSIRGTPSSSKSFVCQDILPNGFLHPEKYRVDSWSGHLKVEGVDYSSLPAITISNGHLHPRSNFPYGFEKQFSSFSFNGTKTPAFSILSDSCNNQYSNDLGGSSSEYQSFQNVGNNAYGVFDSASTIQELPGIRVSDCALSLLSSQSQNSSGHSTGIPMARPQVISGSDTRYSTRCVSDKFTPVISLVSHNGLESKIPSSGLSSADRNHPDPEIADVIVPCLEFSSGKDCLSCEDSPTINLLQLSSQLQRVEHQRQSMQLKQESSDAFGCLQIT